MEKPKAEPTTTLHIRVAETDVLVLREMAEEDHRTIINMIQVILRQAVTQYKEKQGG